MLLPCAIFSLLLTSSLCARVPYIIGGEEASVGAYPWMGSLEYNGKPYCGSSLVHPQWVLTAAHCIIEGKLPSGVVFGLHDLWDWGQGQPKRYAVAEVHVHENYMDGDGSFPNDIALVKLASPVDVDTRFADVINMAEGDQSFSSQTGTLTGWGLKTTWAATTSEPLHVAELKIHKSSHCNMRWRDHFSRENMLCAGVNMQRGACDGDSGGPLAVQEGDAWRLVGIVSWVIGGCAPSEPSVFTKVSAYRPWIDKVMAEN